MKMKKPIAIGAIAAMLSLLVLLFGATAAHAAEGSAAANANANANANAEVRQGIRPDSILYGLQTAIDRIGLALTLDHSEKAEKGLKMARKRLIEVKEMIAENKLEAAQKAQHEHDRTLASVEKAIKKLSKANARAEIDDEIRLEKKLEEHEREVEIVRGQLEIKMRIKGEITAEQQALIDSILDSLQNKTGEVKISIENKKGETRAKIEIKEGKSENEVEDEVEELEEKSGLLELRKQKAEARINVAAEALAEVKAKLSSSNLTLNHTTAAHLAAEAEAKLQRARLAFNESRFGEAFGQATAAGRLVRNADRILSLTAEVEEKIRAAQVIAINARIVGNDTEVTVKLNFVSDSANSSIIARQIKDRLSSLSRENISSILQVENGSAMLGNKLAAEAKVVDGFAIVKSQYRFGLNTTNTTEIVDGIYLQLSALTTANISGELEVKAAAEAEDRKGKREGKEDRQKVKAGIDAAFEENDGEAELDVESEEEVDVAWPAKARLKLKGVLTARRD